MRKRKQAGFTLAELLVSLLILAEIATFTIPKILVSQQNSRYNAAAKEAASMIVAAFQIAQTNGTVTTGMKPSDLLPYMNYTKLDTSSTIDQEYSSMAGATQSCSTANKCIQLHNGGVLLFFDDGGTFGGTSATNAIYLDFDPDLANTDLTTTGPGKAVEFVLYYNGRLSTHWQMHSSTSSSSGPRGMDISANPSWMKW